MKRSDLKSSGKRREVGYMKSSKGNMGLWGAIRIVALALGIIWVVGSLAFTGCTSAFSVQTEKDKQSDATGNRGGIRKGKNRRGPRITRNRNRNIRGQNGREDEKVIKAGDAVRDFSIEINPNGVWSYGWSSTESPGGEFIRYTTSSSSPPFIRKWFVPRNNTENPSISLNNLSSPTQYGNVFHPPDLLNLRPGPNGERSILRWTAPETGNYIIEGRFEGIEKGDLTKVPATKGTTTDVAIIYKGSVALFSAHIDGYGKIAYFSLPEMIRKEETLVTIRRGTMVLTKGETLDFSVGFGADGNSNEGSTGLALKITEAGILK